MKIRIFLTTLAGAVIMATMAVPAAFGQSGVDILQDGYELTESFSSDLGGDAEAFYKRMT